MKVSLSYADTSRAIAVRCATEPDSLSERIRRNSSGAKLSDQLWRAAFGAQISPTGTTGKGDLPVETSEQNICLYLF